MESLRGKRAWITGASRASGGRQPVRCRGLGLRWCSRRGAFDQIEALARKISSQGGSAVVKPLDVADKAASRAHWPRAGGDGRRSHPGEQCRCHAALPLLEDRVDEWEQIIDVNIKGVLFAIRAVLPDMARRGTGTSSTSAPSRAGSRSRAGRSTAGPNSRSGRSLTGCGARRWPTASA